MRAPLTLPRRTALRLTAVTVLSSGPFLASCSSQNSAPATFAERGYPEAPPQRIPPARANGTNLESRPIAELPDPKWLRTTSQRTGIPERALAAYAGASLVMAHRRVDCHIGWNTIAAIGAVESGHGSHGGSRVGKDGTVHPPIIGVPLNGQGKVAAVHDTDDGRLDGDTEWDRAVGPMQFIPETWTNFAQDGNRDGTKNPQNLDDAALTTAVYLCSSGGPMTSTEGWNRAIVTYNQSKQYAQDVADLAAKYAG